MSDATPSPTTRRWLTRRGFLAAAGVGGVAAAVMALRHRLGDRLALLLEDHAFAATPPLLPHDPAREARQLHVSQGRGPAGNIDAVLDKLGGLGRIVGGDDVVVIKVAAQWWDQGMSNVAAVRRVVEQVLAVPGFRGEVIVVENNHFRMPDGSGLSRGFVRPSRRNVDVPGWNKLGDLVPWSDTLGGRASVVGLVDAGTMPPATWDWRDPGFAAGTHGGDGRGPIQPGEERDGYRWELSSIHRLRQSPLREVRTPLTWPVFSSPRTGVVVDFRDGIFRRQGGGRVPTGQRLRFINMTVANEHGDTGLTACCKSPMGLVDMTAGMRGNHPLARGFRAVHYFGSPTAFWRMAGPLAHFAREVRSADLHLAVAEWMGIAPKSGWNDALDVRIETASAVHANTVVAGTDPVAIDAWIARNLLMPAGGKNPHLYDLDDPEAPLVKFLRYYRQVLGSGTLDPALVTVS